MITYADDGMSPHITTSRSLAHALNIPSELLRVHLWIVAGVAPETIPQLAKMVMTDVGTICRLTGISKNTISRKLRTNTPLTIQQGSRVYGVILALDAARSLNENDNTKSIAWLHQPAKGLGGKMPAELLSTSVGVQAVVDLVGRIEHGVY
ncbi:MULTISPECIES: antitoxin Xre/MbcA/ParS toxin-binding domain-containing protein [Aeromonas]|uniref:antitoxin Xre/MbcA/ParS toxin-binding domain-containing protein n=1 Tax=Aeromonas TaxID=642 RepID=UPI0022E27B28|nr:antitoxin Xre/MbcA/ParS toxin-binding domain-containing protein [Aeromonas sp. D3]